MKDGGGVEDSVGSGQGPVAGSCEYSDEPLGSGAMKGHCWVTVVKQWISLLKPIVKQQ
jgi:hypothetical protein